MTNTHEARHHERDYIERTIATVRNHREAENCWPQWANIFADEIEACWADLVEARAVAERTREALRAAREGIVALHQAGWDNLRRDIATEALRTIDDFLAAVPDPEEDAT
jgi:hypothetical protein